VTLPRENASSDLDRFAASVAHEIRTPLTAVAGEIEVALRRDRSADDYREVLRRIAAGVAELVAISSDLALLNEPLDRTRSAAASTRVDALLAAVAQQYAGDASVQVAAGDAAASRVAGDEQRLHRAVTLLVEHAVRHRRSNAIVSVRAAARSEGVVIMIGAGAPGFWPHAWQSLSPDGADADAPLRLRTARRLLDESGGSVRLTPSGDGDAVAIELPPPD